MSDYTPTYILTWNPKVYKWIDYADMADISQSIGIELKTNWSCRSKSPKEGDRFILLMQGMGNKNGVIGYGTILGAPYDLPFSDYGARYVDISFQYLVNHEMHKYVRTDVLKTMFPEQCFTPQFSGVRVKSSILPDLWALIERE